ncbi:MAG: hypothetical protein EZS28_023201 [Streblomastix strix]|uniref:Uncharacterized protein n=1 Tax=Streblomastix strix TaxID=222440 RepID=A0A5J4VFQ5_9EUKA|nr:MAG: hypothetical protein EZS28_023201 [Streblomastix strix]
MERKIKKEEQIEITDEEQSDSEEDEDEEEEEDDEEIQPEFDDYGTLIGFRSEIQTKHQKQMQQILQQQRVLQEIQMQGGVLTYQQQYEQKQLELLKKKKEEERVKNGKNGKRGIFIIDNQVVQRCFQKIGICWNPSFFPYKQEFHFVFPAEYHMEPALGMRIRYAPQFLIARRTLTKREKIMNKRLAELKQQMWVKQREALKRQKKGVEVDPDVEMGLFLHKHKEQNKFRDKIDSINPSGLQNQAQKLGVATRFPPFMPRIMTNQIDFLPSAPGDGRFCLLKLDKQMDLYEDQEEEELKQERQKQKESEMQFQLNTGMNGNEFDQQQITDDEDEENEIDKLSEKKGISTAVTYYTAVVGISHKYL